MLELEKLLSFEIGRNTVRDISFAVEVFVIIFFGLWIFKWLIVQRAQRYAEKTRNRIDDAFFRVLDENHLFLFFFVALFVAARQLVLPETAQMVMWAVLVIILVHESINIIRRFLVHLVRVFWIKDGTEAEQISVVIGIFITVALWSVGILLILSNFGVNVSSLLASLGIGGVAIALAVQNILGDIFSSFSIYFDKPFQVGDFIIVGDHMGTVEHIGLKTTRIRALQGEEIVISNHELTSTRVRNFKKMQQRRVVFSFGVEYGTPMEELRKIPDIVQGIIESERFATFDRAHFKEFADSSLNFEVVYFMTTSDYTEYMNTQQAINLAIVEAFEREGIRMAFPTRTVHLANDRDDAA